MKFSVSGLIPIADASSVVAIINDWSLWRLTTQEATTEEGERIFAFEAWVATSEERLSLFNELKLIVDAYGGKVEWHECTHDEPAPKQCVIAETYAGEG